MSSFLEVRGSLQKYRACCNIINEHPVYVCCSMLQFVAVWCSALQFVALCCNMLVEFFL